MIEESLFSVIALGMMFGIIHAFDADHIMAMATFSDQQTKRKHILTYAFKWGLGHGGILLVLGLLLAFIGFKLPEWFVHYSEMLVGVVLIYLGSKLILLLHNKNIIDLDSAAPKLAKPLKGHDHTPLFIGMLHGVAGSAPLLALLPNMHESQFLLHIALFSTGCLVGMFCFGLVFGAYQTHIKSIKHFKCNVANLLTRLLGVSSISLGAFWLLN
ncbi:MAG: hypothetical protein ACSHW0_17830 [Thalassotalea sp.]